MCASRLCESECVCVCVRKRSACVYRVCGCLCMREGGGERERERDCACVHHDCVRERVCVRGRERLHVSSVCVKESVCNMKVCL